MKLRQKLAIVLASAMVITAVPVTTMAKSTNGFNTTVSMVEGTVLDGKVNLEMDFAKGQTSKETDTTTFFVNATDFEFNKDKYTTNIATTGTLIIPGAVVECLDKSTLRVTVTVKKDEDVKISIPVLGKVLKGNPALTVDGEGSLATSGKYSLTGTEVSGDKEYTATAGDAKNVSVDGVGTIADITIEEKVIGAFAKDASGKVEIQVKLPNRSDLDFDATTTQKNIVIEGKRGHAAKTIKATVDYPRDAKDKITDEKVLIISMNASDFSSTERGSIVIKNIAVQPEDARKGCSTGEVKVTVTEVAGLKNATDKESTRLAETTLVVANVSEFDTTLTIADDAKVKATAGKGTKEVTVKVKETAIGSWDDRKDMFFTLEGAHFDEANKATIKLNDGTAYTVEIKDGEFQLDLSDIDRNKINTFEIKFKVYADVNQSGAIKLVAESKNFDEDKTVEIGTVTAPFEVTAEAMTVKVGLQGQVGGKIAITETDKGMFEKGDVFYIEESKYFDIDDAKVEVTKGDLEIESKVKNGKIEVTVKRTSDEASTITVSDIDVTTSRILPEGKFDVEIYGDISYMNNSKNPGYDADKTSKTDVITLKDFFVVGTKNTEDLPNAAAAKEIVLTVGATDYTVNGEAKTADAAAFIDANNRTMVPVRFVAEEFGKIDFGTVNGVGTVTVFKDGSVLQFQNGSNVMNKNGIAIPMDTNVVIKDGRTYVPFKYVADGLGINYNFDAATKSITFTNQAK